MFFRDNMSLSNRVLPRKLDNTDKHQSHNSEDHNISQISTHNKTTDNECQ